ncbi:MAG: 2-oxoglutarate dehydrogenase, E2 component, dihydrolipoamide succinyltransferase [Gaiellales bacterium]
MTTGTAVEVVMPQMGVSVSEGTITRWFRAEGDQVAADEPLLEISTDKVDTEVPCPADGVLGPILVAEGETVAVGTSLATILPPGSLAPAPVAPAPGPPAEAPAPVAPMVPASDATLAGIPTLPPEPEPEPIASPEQAAAPSEAQADGEARAFVSPVVSRIAAEHAVDVSRVTGTGRGGRVTKKDILAYVESGAAAVPAPPAAPAAPAVPPPAPAPAPPQAPAATPSEVGAGETIEPMSVIRRAIAEHMIRSTQTSAHVTTLFEVDMSKVVAMRERLKKEYEHQHGVKLTYLAFIARATVDALQRWPWLNSELRDNQIVVKRYVNLGIAVALDDGKGLIVPVIRHAEEKNLLGIARAIQDLADRARSKKLVPDEVQSGTFTITNPGGFGAIAGTPIINQPQVAILDVEAIVKRPVVVTDEHGNDAIGIRPIMNLSLSYDHRLVDGAYAAPFMRDLKTSLETWDEDAY